MSYDHIKPVYQLGPSTFPVQLDVLHKKNRDKLVNAVTEGGVDVDACVALFQGGESEMRHDTDHETVFRQESFFQYLFGVKEPDFYGVICLDSGESILFIPRLPESYAVWMGEIYPPEYYKKLYAVDHAYYVDELEHVLAEVLKVKAIHVLDGVNSDSGSSFKSPQFNGIENFEIIKTDLMHHLVECRVIKTEEEIELMRYVNKISSDAHIEVMKKCRPGMCEYQCEAFFRYYVYDKGGCRHCSYTCICGSGPSGAILHYGHAGAPNDRQINDGDILMFDMGGEYHCYGADISRSYPINGVYTEGQKQIYNTVFCAQEAVFDALKPGVNWKDMHRLADRVIAEKLSEYGFLTGDIEEIMQNFIPSLFMPHGLGHLLGIDTHDCGGYPNGMERVQEPGLRSLRMGRDLMAGMIVTVEPGVYFNPITLEKALQDPVQSKYLVADKIRDFYNFGGVRIEDDVLITETGMENLTTTPRTIEEIEAIMAEARSE
eukprot:TRINITY_DN595_c1_g1_i1.p1 TRINITY_DN595_c1_g1~~TRINITY_DN595_c1_g1_i1.p1  ORF type:complete len:518 (-),score=131.96 TRINITY_DN595_c1_g1_i1:13-1479(-)